LGRIFVINSSFTEFELIMKTSHSPFIYCRGSCNGSCVANHAETRATACSFNLKYRSAMFVPTLKNTLFARLKYLPRLFYNNICLVLNIAAPPVRALLILLSNFTFCGLPPKQTCQPGDQLHRQTPPSPPFLGSLHLALLPLEPSDRYKHIISFIG
jgi:hypothetical protein